MLTFQDLEQIKALIDFWETQNKVKGIISKKITGNDTLYSRKISNIRIVELHKL